MGLSPAIGQFIKDAPRRRDVRRTASEEAALEGIDYYLWEVTVDWQGWRGFDVPFDGFQSTREPLGWDQINQLKEKAGE